MFGCLLTAVGCTLGDDKDPKERKEGGTQSLMSLDLHGWK